MHRRAEVVNKGDGKKEHHQDHEEAQPQEQVNGVGIQIEVAEGGEVFGHVIERAVFMNTGNPVRALSPLSPISGTQSPLDGF